MAASAVTVSNPASGPEPERRPAEARQRGLGDGGSSRRHSSRAGDRRTDEQPDGQAANEGVGAVARRRAPAAGGSRPPALRPEERHHRHQPDPEACPDERGEDAEVPEAEQVDAEAGTERIARPGTEDRGEEDDGRRPPAVPRTSA